MAAGIAFSYIAETCQARGGSLNPPAAQRASLGRKGAARMHFIN
jgi:hypothetical protein